jgi:DMSO reductase anchor subunit/NAD-dependent dihydropyrimidine dehydrogenase PreA subunit
LINTGLCIGCKYCSWACPFDAPRYNHVTGTISKCTFCNDRLLEGRNPACTTLCPTGALQFAELPAQPAVEGVPGFPEAGTGPAIQFVPLRSAAAGPELSAAPDEHSAVADMQTLEVAPAPKVTIESEWSLVFFSIATALLVAIASAAAAGSMQIGAPDFLIAALGALGVSVLHLGKWQRAWRGVLNLRHSWLSREIFLYLAFTVLTATMLFFPASAPALAWPAVLSGFGGLFCIDQVYESVSRDKWLRLHSGRAILTGLFLFGILAANPVISGLTGFLKLVLYSYRQSWFKSNARAMASVMRLGLGIVAPLAIWKVYPDWVLPSVLVAEVIDRCEYYLDLDIMTPQLRIAMDLQSRTAELRPPASDPRP